MLRTLRENPRTAAILFAAVLIFPALLAERLAVPVRYVLPDHSGRELIALRLLYLLPILTGALSVALMPGTFSRVLRMRYAAIGLVCLGIDIAVYLLAGALELSFKATLAFPLAALASAGAMLTGVALFRLVPAAVDCLVASATSISAVVGGFQMAEALGHRTPVGVWLVRWDQATAQTFHTKIAWMRAEGFAQNPNMYTPFAVVGFIWALFGAQKGPARWVTLAASVAIALLGQSQTTMVILIALLALAFVKMLSTRARSGGSKRVVAILAVTVLLVAGVVTTRSLTARTADPYPDTVSAAVNEEPAQSGIGSRLDVWGESVLEARSNMWGTFGRTVDRLKPYSHAHNEVLHRLLYAGPFWPLVYVAFVVWALVWLRPLKMPWLGGAIALALFLNGITEVLDRMHPYNVLLFVIIGCAMYAMAQEQAVSAGESADAV